MSRALRFLLTALFFVSLLLCVAAAVLWVRSYWYVDEVDAQLSRLNAHASSLPGWAGLSASLFDDPEYTGRYHWEWSCMSMEDVGMLGMPLGFSIRLGGSPYLGGVWVTPILRADVPHWAIVLVASTLSASTALLLRRQGKRRTEGRCACSYDLTGNESGVCPECGTPVPVQRKVT